MAKQPTRAELIERIDELETDNETLMSQLDEIADIVAPPEELEDGSDELPKSVPVVRSVDKIGDLYR